MFDIVTFKTLKPVGRGSAALPRALISMGFKLLHLISLHYYCIVQNDLKKR